MNSSGVDKGHCNVASAIGGGQAFVQVSQTSWVHEAPAFPGRLNGTVVSMETTPPSLQDIREYQSTKPYCG